MLSHTTFLANPLRPASGEEHLQVAKLHIIAAPHFVLHPLLACAFELAEAMRAANRAPMPACC